MIIIINFNVETAQPVMSRYVALVTPTLRYFIYCDGTEINIHIDYMTEMKCPSVPNSGVTFAVGPVAVDDY